jgi:hypothetical protein
MFQALQDTFNFLREILGIVGACAFDDTYYKITHPLFNLLEFTFSKYLFKYVYKGHDRATVEISRQSDNATKGNVVDTDEI